MIEVVEGAQSPPVTGKVHEGIWIMGHGLVTVDVSELGAWLMVLLEACQYGSITPECDEDLAEAGELIKGMGYTRTGQAKEEDGIVSMELL